MRITLWKHLREGDRFQFMPGMKTYTVARRDLARARGYVVITTVEPLAEGNHTCSRHGDDQITCVTYSQEQKLRIAECIAIAERVGRLAQDRLKDVIDGLVANPMCDFEPVARYLETGQK